MTIKLISRAYINQLLLYDKGWFLNFAQILGKKKAPSKHAPTSSPAYPTLAAHLPSRARYFLH